MSRTRAVLTTVALLSALALSGCTDDDPDPKFAPPSSSAPTSPSSASSSAAAALSPEDTVRAWVDARNAALDDGDLAQVLRLTSAACKSCDGILDPIRQVYEDGGRFTTDGWAVAAAKTTSESEAKAKVSTGLEFAGGKTVPEQGAEPVVYAPEKHIVVFRLTNEAGTWRVSFVGFLS